MSNPKDVYEYICSTLKTPTDGKLLRALLDVYKSGELNIAGISVTSQTCEIVSKVLTQSKDIVKLNASDCLLPPQGLALLLSVVHLTNLHSLQLRGNNIGGPSVYKLSKMLTRSSNIKNLGLEWNNLGLCSEGMSQFCNALANNHSLETLDLRNNQLDEECAVLLTGALRKNTSLRALDVCWNSMEQVGGQHFLTALHSNKTLTNLKLQGNSISNDLLTATDQCVQHNSSMLRLESGYEARKELLSNHVKAVQERRVQELQEYTEKSQLQVDEMETKVKDIQESLICKQRQVEELEKAVAETSRGVEAGQNQVRGLQEELKMQEQSHMAVTRDYQLQLDILNKALAANKSSLTDLNEELQGEMRVREDLEKEKEKDKVKLKQLDRALDKMKEELQVTITDHIGAVEQERKQFQQRVLLLEEEWNGRLEQKAAEQGRAEQVYRDRVRALETALETAERDQAEQSLQWASERGKWAEEKANIWAEAREKESFKILLLTEKVEHLKEEKTSLETQLSVANSTSQQLQRDNANVVADLAELRRKLTTVQEDLSCERLLSQKLRSEKAEDLRALESVRGELSCAQRNVSEALARQEELQRELRRQTERLEDKERHINNIRKEEKDRASLLVSAIKNYVDQLNSGNT